MHVLKELLISRSIHIVFRGTFAQKKKNLCYSFNGDENLQTHVKFKIKWGNHYELFFPIFFIENDLYTENVKKGGSR